MFYPGYNPYQQNYQQQNNGLIRVTGMEGAKAYQMSANSNVALFDANDDVFYVKSTDGANFPTIRAFKFEEISQASQGFGQEYVTKKEMEEYVKQFISATAET